MLSEGSVYAAPGADDGVRCLVMRQWPRGVVYERVDVWLKELGPTTEQLRDLDAGRIHWGQYSCFCCVDACDAAPMLVASMTDDPSGWAVTASMTAGHNLDPRPSTRWLK